MKKLTDNEEYDKIEDAVGFHFKFRTEILEHSVEKKNFKKACMEWHVIRHYVEEQYARCICTNSICNCYVIFNSINYIHLEPIGSSCIQHIINAGNDIMGDELIWFQNLKKINNVEIDKINTYCFNCLKKIRSNKENREYVINYCNNCKDDTIINNIINLKEQICNSIQQIKIKKLAIKGKLPIFVNKYMKIFTYKELYKKDKKYCKWMFNTFDRNNERNFGLFYYLDTKFTY